MTENIIADETTTITLQRTASARTAAGGMAPSGVAAPLAPIEVFFGAKVQDDLPLQDNSGERVIAYYTIVAMPGADIKEKDTFSVGPDQFIVTRVSNHLSYECKADAQTYYGGYR